MKESIKSSVVNMAKYFISIGLIYWLIASGKLNFELLKAIAAPSIVVQIFILGALNIFLASYRWRLLLKDHVDTFPILKIFKLSCMGLFFNFAMPGGVGGDIVKGYHLVSENKSKTTKTIISVAMDRLIGLYCMILMGALAMLIDYDHVQGNTDLKLIFTSMISIWLVFTTFLLISFSNRLQKKISLILNQLEKFKIGQFLKKIYSAVFEYSKSKSAVIKAVLLTLLAQVLGILIFYVIGETLMPGQLPLSLYFIASPIGFIITALPITPGGVGLGQAAFYSLFNLYYDGAGVVGVTAVTSLQVIQFCFGLYGAYYFARHKAIPGKTKNIPQTS
jgi:uncharacterized protein (TIRG00374 family)